jgi:hypothetical protein
MAGGGFVDALARPHDRDDLPPPDGRRGPRPPPPSKAAHFRMRHGDGMVDAKCAADEPAKARADFTLELLDRVLAQAKP